MIWSLPLMLSLAGAPPVDRVEFRLEDHLILVSGSVGAVEPVTMVIDTATTYTFVSRELALRLGLEGTSGRAVSPAGVVSLLRTRLTELKFGDQVFVDVEARISDLSALSRGRFDVIVGLDVLRRQNLTIDYQQRRLEVGANLSDLDLKPMPGGLPFLLVPTIWEGERRWMMLDTAAAEVLLYEDPSRHRPGARIRAQRLIRHLGGASRLRPVALPKFVLGGRQWPALRGYRLDAAAPPADGVAGIVSPHRLGVTRLLLDFQNSRFGIDGGAGSGPDSTLGDVGREEGTRSGDRASYSRREAPRLTP